MALLFAATLLYIRWVYVPLVTHSTGLIVPTTTKEHLFPQVEATTTSPLRPAIDKQEKQTLDLSATALESVGECFLCNSEAETIVLPPSLRTIGGGFLEGFRGKRLVLIGAALESVGDRFLASSAVEELVLPPSLKSVGNGFLRLSRGKRLDLIDSQIERVGDNFCADSAAQEIVLPSSLKSVGFGFLVNFQGKKPDLARKA